MVTSLTKMTHDRTIATPTYGQEYDSHPPPHHQCTDATPMCSHPATDDNCNVVYLVLLVNTRGLHCIILFYFIIVIKGYEPNPGVNPHRVSTPTPVGTTHTPGCRGAGVMWVGVRVEPQTPQG